MTLTLFLCITDKETGEFVAFTASTTYKDPLPNGPIQYDNVVARIGTAYDPTTGIFTAHVPGLYSFSVSLMGLYTDTVYAMLYKNGVSPVRLYTRGQSTHEVASNTVYFKLSKGDRVWVQGTAGKKLYASEPFNVFSGALIKSGLF